MNNISSHSFYRNMHFLEPAAITATTCFLGMAKEVRCFPSCFSVVLVGCVVGGASLVQPHHINDSYEIQIRKIITLFGVATFISMCTYRIKNVSVLSAMKLSAGYSLVIFVCRLIANFEHHISRANFHRAATEKAGIQLKKELQLFSQGSIDPKLLEQAILDQMDEEHKKCLLRHIDLGVAIESRNFRLVKFKLEHEPVGNVTLEVLEKLACEHENQLNTECITCLLWHIDLDVAIKSRNFQLIKFILKYKKKGEIDQQLLKRAYDIFLMCHDNGWGGLIVKHVDLDAAIASRNSQFVQLILLNHGKTGEITQIMLDSIVHVFGSQIDAECKKRILRGISLETACSLNCFHLIVFALENCHLTSGALEQQKEEFMQANKALKEKEEELKAANEALEQKEEELKQAMEAREQKEEELKEAKKEWEPSGALSRLELRMLSIDLLIDVIKLSKLLRDLDNSTKALRAVVETKCQQAEEALKKKNEVLMQAKDALKEKKEELKEAEKALEQKEEELKQAKEALEQKEEELKQAMEALEQCGALSPMGLSIPIMPLLEDVSKLRKLLSDLDDSTEPLREVVEALRQEIREEEAKPKGTLAAHVIKELSEDCQKNFETVQHALKKIVLKCLDSENTDLDAHNLQILTHIDRQWATENYREAFLKFEKKCNLSLSTKT